MLIHSKQFLTVREGYPLSTALRKKVEPKRLHPGAVLENGVTLEGGRWCISHFLSCHNSATGGAELRTILDALFFSVWTKIKSPLLWTVSDFKCRYSGHCRLLTNTDLYTNDFDVIAISETWLKDNVREDVGFRN